MKTRKLLLGSILGLGLLSTITSCEETEVATPVLGPIVLDCDYFETNQTLVDDPDRAVDYFIDCLMFAEADITVMPGVVIEFGSDAGIEVTPTGSFSAEGTSSEPILFTGESKVKGAWKGLLFDSNDTKNKLHNVDINYAGGGTFNSNGDQASIIIWRFAKLSIQSSSIMNSASHGISANYDQSDWSISESSISFADQAPINMFPVYFDALDGSNTYSNNVDNHILVDLYIYYIEENTTIQNLQIPYQIHQSASGYPALRVDAADITIEPGTVIQFEDGTGFHIEDDASLTAIGTLTNPIIFTGTSKVKGSWGGIYFDSTTSTSNQIKNATVEYTGNNMWYNQGLQGGIVMWFSPYINLEDVTFQYIDGCSTIHRTSPVGGLNPNLSYSNLTHIDTDGVECSN